MNMWLIIVAVIVVLVLVAIAAAAWAFSRKRRSERLRRQFGPEYDHTVATTGDRHQAESELAEREKRTKSLKIRSLTQEEVNRFSDEWQRVQSRFVDEPNEAITDAELLVGEVMEARGYPAAGYERRISYLSVNHPQAVQNYRVARTITHHDGRNEVTSEDLRRAMAYYRELFEDLLATDDTRATESRKVKIEEVSR
jgi:FtsZ-interacting cell division protein ZipA